MKLQDSLLAVTVQRACELTGIGRTKIFEPIRLGQLPARKCGRRTLILIPDLVRLLESLPQRQLPTSKNAQSSGGAR